MKAAVRLPIPSERKEREEREEREKGKKEDESKKMRDNITNTQSSMSGTRSHDFSLLPRVSKKSISQKSKLNLSLFHDTSRTLSHLENIISTQAHHEFLLQHRENERKRVPAGSMNASSTW